jgi:hypothetical protein
MVILQCHSLRMNMKAFTLIIISSICFVCFIGCSDASNAGWNNLNVSPVCEAYECHTGTQLKIYPPISGAHYLHLGLYRPGVPGMSLGCKSCHNRYKNSGGGLHQNGFINGYDWRYRVKTAGDIVSFGPLLTGPNPAIAFDHATGKCSGTGSSCHDISGPHDSPQWYAGNVCGSCHAGPPINQFPPKTGAHAVHRYKKFECQTCHNQYMSNPLHQNGTIEGSALDPLATAVNTIVFFSGSGSWSNPSTADCSSTGTGCHGTKNWYNYPYTSDAQCGVCHVYPPLSKFPPTSGLHNTHSGERCATCHYNYTINYVKGVSTHNNGTVNGYVWQTGTRVPGNIVIFHAPAGGSASFNHATGDCTSIGCHDNQNWYSGGGGN